MIRSRWHVAVHIPVLGWLATAALVAIARQQVPAASWLMVHLLLLGAASSAILVWSRHFTEAVLRLPPGRHRADAVRLVLLNAGVLVMAGGMVGAAQAVVFVGAGLALAAAAGHAVSLARSLRSALPSRFRVAAQAYLVATLMLLIGIGLGVLLARGGLDAEASARVLLAHAAVNVMGWLGIAILGTLLTLWPTMLRTPLAPGAERAARWAVPLMAGATLLTAAGLLADLRPVAGVGLLAAIVALGLICWPMAHEARSAHPAGFAAWSTLAGSGWLAVGALVLGVGIATSPRLAGIATTGGTLVSIVAVGGVLQVLLGALSQLLPVVTGGGPAVMAARRRRLDSGSGARLLLLNLGLLVCLLPAPSAVRGTASVVVLAAAGWSGWLLAGALRALTPAPGADDMKGVHGPLRVTDNP